MVFSPDGKRLATAGQDRAIRVWNSSTGAELAEFEESSFFPVWPILFSPDGKLVGGALGKSRGGAFTTPLHQIRFRDMATGQVTYELPQA